MTMNLKECMQDVLDRAVAHLVKQGGHSVHAGTKSTCAYRGTVPQCDFFNPASPPAKMCGIGALIHDDLYRKSFEDMVASQLVLNYGWGVFGDKYTGLDGVEENELMNFMDMVQSSCHDEIPVGISEKLFADMVLDSAAELAIDYGLNNHFREVNNEFAGN